MKENEQILLKGLAQRLFLIGFIRTGCLPLTKWNPFLPLLRKRYLGGQQNLTFLLILTFQNRKSSDFYTSQEWVRPTFLLCLHFGFWFPPSAPRESCWIQKGRQTFLNNCRNLTFFPLFQVLDEALKICNYIFTIIFVMESVFKLIAFGFRRFFQDR